MTVSNPLAVSSTPAAAATVAARPTGVARTAAATSAGGASFAAALQRADSMLATSAAGDRPVVAAATTATPPGLAGRVALDTGLLSLGRSPSPIAGTAPDAAFVAGVFARLGVSLPADASRQAAMGAPVGSLADARSGDLVVVGGDPGTVGLYAGHGRILHAPADGRPVRLEAIDGPVRTIRRIVTEPVAATATMAATPATFAGLAAGAVASSTVAAGTVSAGTVRAGTGGAGLDPTPYRSLFEQAGARHGVDPALLAAVAEIESGFDPGAGSSAGAQGLMQFMPSTAAGMGVDPWDPASAIDGAARYLRQNLDRFGTTELALAAYNAGPGAVARHGGVPPFTETRNYVRKVLHAMGQYR